MDDFAWLFFGFIGTAAAFLVPLYGIYGLLCLLDRLRAGRGRERLDW